MSQYPYNAPGPVPYGGYGYYQQNPLETLLAPAKRASIFLFIMGGLMIPCGILMGLVSFADFSQLSGPQAAQLELLESEFSTLGWTVKGFFQVLGAILLVPGVLLVVLGVMVRRGGMGSVVSSIIVCCLMALLAGFATISGILQAGQGGGQAIMGACIWGVMLTMLIITLVFLFQAAKNSGQLSLYRAQYESQMYQAQQNQQMYQGFPPQQYPQQQYPPQQQQQWGQQQQQQWPGQQQWPPPPQNPT